MTPERCPSCGADLRGTPIPPDQRGLYGGARHTSRVIGLYFQDRTVAWECPDCHHVWPRTEPTCPGAFRTHELRRAGLDDLREAGIHGQA